MFVTAVLIVLVAAGALLIADTRVDDDDPYRSNW